MEEDQTNRSRSSSLDDDNYSDYSDGAGYVSCEDTLPTHQSEEEQQKPLLSSYDVKHPVHDGFPSQPPGNEQLQYPLQQQQQQLVSAENGDLEKTVENQQLPGTIIDHVGNEYETEIETKERLSEKDQGVTERLRNESRKYLKRLDETLLKNEQLSTRNEHLEKRILQLEAVEEENTRLQSKLVAKSGKHSTRLEGAIQENAELDKRAKQLESLYQGTLQKLSHIEKETERLANALKAKDHLEGDMQQLSTEFSKKTNELVLKLHELADRQEECTKLETDCDELEKEKNSIQARFDATCDELKEKKEELVIAEDMHIEVSTQVHKLKVDHAEEIQNLGESLFAMESDRNELATRAMSLGAENTQLTTHLQTKTNELERSEQACTKLNEKVTSLTSQVSAMSQHVDFAVEEKIQVAGSFKTKLEEAEEQRDTFRSQKEASMRILAQRNIEKNNLEAQLLDLRHRFDSETKRLREDLNEANGERMRYQMELNSLSLSSGVSQGFPYANEVGQPYQARQPPHDDHAPENHHY